jgi:hypothetical protein
MQLLGRIARGGVMTRWTKRRRLLALGQLTRRTCFRGGASISRIRRPGGARSPAARVGQHELDVAGRLGPALAVAAVALRAPRTFAARSREIEASWASLIVAAGVPEAGTPIGAAVSSTVPKIDSVPSPLSISSSARVCCG